jgi:hypothetical protein
MSVLVYESKVKAEVMIFLAGRQPVFGKKRGRYRLGEVLPGLHFVKGSRGIQAHGQETL